MQVGITVITDKFLAGGFWHRDIIIYQTGHDLQGGRGAERYKIDTTLLLFTTVHTAGYLSVDFAQSSFAETVENRIDNHHHNQDHGDDDDHFHSGLKS